MKSNEFVKTTGNEKKLSGLQKAAILLGELGLDAGQQVIELLNLSTDEIKKLRNCMKALGPYPRNINDILREESVLKETISYGQFKGIYHPVQPTNNTQTSQSSLVAQNKTEVSKLLKEDPSAITNLIRSWLEN